jgi:hypothetical protein
MLLILFFSFPTSLKKKPSYTQIKMSGPTGSGTTVTTGTVPNPADPSRLDQFTSYMQETIDSISNLSYKKWRDEESDHPWLASMVGEWEGLLYGGGIVLCLFMWLLAMGSVFESSNDGMMFASFIILLSIFIAWYLHRTIRRRDPLGNLGAFGFTVTLSSLFFMFFYFSALVYGSAIMNTETIWILNIALSCVGMFMLAVTRFFKLGYSSGEHIQLMSDNDSKLLEKAHRIIREATHEYYFRGYYRHWEVVEFKKETLQRILDIAQETETYKENNDDLHDLVEEIFVRTGNNPPKPRFNHLLNEHIIKNYQKLLRVPKNSTPTSGPTPGPTGPTPGPLGNPGASVITAASAASAAANTAVETPGIPVNAGQTVMGNP